ncbi:hypothetical protein [Sphingomonas sp.]|uniref:hypothetical protein n=1 Tax=Sphingomonas sp. TaxID=28214 RepID=UPI001B096487|nr:hypothetical protein [Sphingomonas sp.]MBO9712192.1 hypothetical protein [Sphingomonas sp.]
MTKRLRLLPLLLLLLAASPLTITKTSSVVSDPTGQLFPKAIPGAVVDYTITVANPVANSLSTIKTVEIKDAIPARTTLRVADLGVANSGPVAFSESLIPSSGLTYSFQGMSSTIDSLSFSSDGGTTWTYTPTADANGYDSNVTNIRVRLSGNQTAGSNFSLRFRVKVK